MKKTVVLAIVVLVMGIVAAFCGGCSGGGGAAQITEEELIEGVTTSAEKASSYRFEIDGVIDMKGTSEGEYAEVSFIADGTGAADEVAREMQMDMNIRGNLKEAGEQERMTARLRMYLLGDTVYLGTQEDGGAEEWVTADATEALRQSRDLLSQNVDIVRGADVKVLGTENVKGVTCHVAEIHPDLDKLLDLMGSLYGSGMPIPLTSDTVSDFRCKGWYAKDSFFPMKLYQEYDLNFKEGADKVAGHITSNMVLYDYNKPVSIVLPPEAKSGASGATRPGPQSDRDAFETDQEVMQLATAAFYSDTHAGFDPTQHDWLQSGQNSGHYLPTYWGDHTQHTLTVDETRLAPDNTGNPMIVDPTTGPATDANISNAAIWVGLLYNAPGEEGATGSRRLDRAPREYEDGPYVQEIARSSMADGALPYNGGIGTRGSYCWVVGEDGQVYGAYKAADRHWYSGFSGVYP